MNSRPANSGRRSFGWPPPPASSRTRRPARAARCSGQRRRPGRREARGPQPHAMARLEPAPRRAGGRRAGRRPPRRRGYGQPRRGTPTRTGTASRSSATRVRTSRRAWRRSTPRRSRRTARTTRRRSPRRRSPPSASASTRPPAFGDRRRGADARRVPARLVEAHRRPAIPTAREPGGLTGRPEGPRADPLVGVDTDDVDPAPQRRPRPENCGEEVGGAQLARAAGSPSASPEAREAAEHDARAGSTAWTASAERVSISAYRAGWGRGHQNAPKLGSFQISKSRTGSRLAPGARARTSPLARSAPQARGPGR